jgi:hypothetical protein
VAIVATPFQQRTEDMQNINQGQPVTPDGFAVGRESAPTSSEAKLPIYPRLRLYPFVLIHEGEWELGEVEGKPVVLPMLTTRTEMPGCNNIAHSDRGGSSRADAKLQDLGHVKLTAQIPEYRREYSSRPGKDGQPVIAYFDAWDRIRTWPTGEFLIKRDHAGYDAWRATLLSRRLISPPTELEEEKLRTRFSEKLNRCSARGDANEPRIKDRIKSLKERSGKLAVAIERARMLYDGEPEGKGGQK